MSGLARTLPIFQKLGALAVLGTNARANLACLIDSRIHNIWPLV